MDIDGLVDNRAGDLIVVHKELSQYFRSIPSSLNVVAPHHRPTVDVAVTETLVVARTWRSWNGYRQIWKSQRFRL